MIILTYQNMRKIYLSILLLAFAAIIPASAAKSIKLGFTRTGTDAASVTISVTDENGTSIEGAAATLTTSHEFKGTGNAVTESIICPNVNGNTSPTIKLTFTITGVPEGFTFDNINAHIHALNNAGKYQEIGDGVVRQWNVEAKQGDELANFGSLSNIDIAAGIPGANKEWSIAGSKVAANGTIVVELTITAGGTNSGCFFGLSALALTNENSDEGGEGGEDEEETPTVNPDTENCKIYNISWKTTGGNYATEGSDGSIYVAGYAVTERQFWRFIPTGNENCYYIQNTATGRYIGSCNKTPSSASRITTTTEPVEYYVAPTSATSGEIKGCHYFSSTDCDNYSNEAAGPRALNKDGASNYVITWQAGTSRVGSYWKLIETTDLYEIRPFEPSSTIGNIEVSYNISTATRNIAIAPDGSIIMSEKDLADDKQGWYFVGSNNREGYIIASTSDLTSAIAINNGVFTASAEGNRWKVYASKENAEQYYFKTVDGGETLFIDGDSLFTFGKQRNAYARGNQIYNNPCGALSSNYITAAKLHGDDALSTITYEAASAPANWHVLYTTDRGRVAMGGSFTLDITLAKAASNDMAIHAYFDWDADGIFETTQQMSISGSSASGTFTAPETASTAETRMRVRVNENGFNNAEDDVEGVVYDFVITAAPAMKGRTVTIGTNAKGRGTATLSQVADEYEKGTTLTATATPSGSNSFICWKEGNIIVSTEAEYTFSVDHNIALTAYFTPDTANGDDIITGIASTTATTDVEIAAGEGYIQAVSSDEVKSIAIYTSNAALAGKAKGDKISIAGLSKGIYIVKVRTADGEKNIKFYNR